MLKLSEPKKQETGNNNSQIKKSFFFHTNIKKGTVMESKHAVTTEMRTIKLNQAKLS